MSKFAPNQRLTDGGIEHVDIIYMNDWFPENTIATHARDRVYVSHVDNLGQEHREAGLKLIQADIEYSSVSELRKDETDIWWLRGSTDRYNGPFDASPVPSNPDRTATVQEWRDLFAAYQAGYQNYGEVGLYNGLPDFYNVGYQTALGNSSDAATWETWYEQWMDDVIPLFNDVDVIFPEVYGNWARFHPLSLNPITNISYNQEKTIWEDCYRRIYEGIKSRWPTKRIIWLIGIEAYKISGTPQPYPEDAMNWQLKTLTENYPDTDIAVWGSDSSSWSQTEFTDGQMDLMLAYHDSGINSSTGGNTSSGSRQFDDYSVSKELNRATITSNKQQWVDLDLSLTRNPNTSDISFLRDDRAVKNAVKNLIITNFFERPFQPMKGANLKGLLFEPADDITKVKLREAIGRVLTQYEPRVEVRYIEIIDLADRNEYNVTISFLIKEIRKEETVEIQLKRLR